MAIKKIIFLFLGMSLPLALMAEPMQFMEARKKNYTVAITQIVDHPVLTKAYQGIIAGLEEQGYEQGHNLTVVYNNAQGDIKTAEKIAQDFVKMKPDLIMPISTASAQAIVTADKTARIPVVFAAVTDPIAAQLVPTLIQPGGYVTGVYDFPPIAKQIDIIQKILPQIKTLGVLYNPGEINSLQMIKELKKTLPTSITILEAPVTSAQTVSDATRSLIGKVDAIYVPADNTVVANIDTVLKITQANNLPVFASEQGSVEKGALAALAYNQYEVGYLAGKMAGEILSGKKPGALDVVTLANPQLYMNTHTAQTLNITIPEPLSKSAVIKD
jgi:putative ABC transport system substrate-binding protein